MYHTTRAVLLVLSVLCLTTMTPQQARAASRVLEAGFTVNDSWSFDCTCSTEITSGATTATGLLTWTLTETVDEDNGDGSFDISEDQTAMQWTENSGTPTNQTSRSSSTAVLTPSGKIVTQPNLKYLLNMSSIAGATWDTGSIADTDGLFVTTAVDVNDTWTVDHVTTPYGQSAQTVTATATLLAWTTQGGYNVAKIRYTWTEPVRLCRSSGTTAYLEGELEVERIVYYAYAEKQVVRIELTVDGTALEFTEGADVFWLDYAETTTMDLD
jgi:hypothetical protein